LSGYRFIDIGNIHLTFIKYVLQNGCFEKQSQIAIACGDGDGSCMFNNNNNKDNDFFFSFSVVLIYIIRKKAISSATL